MGKCDSVPVGNYLVSKSLLAHRKMIKWPLKVSMRKKNIRNISPSFMVHIAEKATQ